MAASRKVLVLVTHNPGDKPLNYSVLMPQVPGCLSCCNSLEEARTNSVDALGIYTEDSDEELMPAPDPALWLKENFPEERLIAHFEVEI